MAYEVTFITYESVWLNDDELSMIKKEDLNEENISQIIEIAEDKLKSDTQGTLNSDRDWSSEELHVYDSEGVNCIKTINLEEFS